MYTLVLAVHVVLAVTLVGLVLLQQGKGADVGAVMGGGANTLFGVGGASSLLVRMTTGIAVAFMLTSVLLVRLSVSKSGGVKTAPDAMSGSVLEGVAVPATESANQPASTVPNSAVPNNPVTSTEGVPAGEALKGEALGDAKQEEATSALPAASQPVPAQSAPEAVEATGVQEQEVKEPLAVAPEPAAAEGATGGVTNPPVAKQ